MTEKHDTAPNSEAVIPLGEYECTCGGHITLGEVRASGEAVALHTMPMCAWFEKADGNELVRAWRAKVGS